MTRVAHARPGDAPAPAALPPRPALLPLAQPTLPRFNHSLLQEGQTFGAIGTHFRYFASKRQRQPSGPAASGSSSKQRKVSAAHYAAALAVGSWAAYIVEEPSLEEAPLTGRARPAMPANSLMDSVLERIAQINPDAWFNSQLPFCGRGEQGGRRCGWAQNKARNPACALWSTKQQSSFASLPPAHAGATLYPANHPLTKRAEAARDEFLAAAQAQIEQQQGADSPAAVRFKKQLAKGPPPVRVFGSEAAYVGGLCGAGGLIVSDRVDQMTDTMAHEAAHFILQHGSEPEAVIQYARSRARNQGCAVWGTGAATAALLCQRARSARLAGALLGSVNGWALWRSWSGPSWDVRPETNNEPLRDDEELPLLLPGDPEFNLPTRQALASRTMCIELEAERVALLMFAWWVDSQGWFQCQHALLQEMQHSMGM